MEHIIRTFSLRAFNQRHIHIYDHKYAMSNLEEKDCVELRKWSSTNRFSTTDSILFLAIKELHKDGIIGKTKLLWPPLSKSIDELLGKMKAS